MKNNEVITKELEKEYEILINKYGENRILLIAAIGEIMYNISNKYDILCIYIPTEDELYNISYINKDNNIIDIRELCHLINNKDDRLIKLTLTKYKIINNKYENYINNNFFSYLQILLLENNNDILNNFKLLIKEIIKINIECNNSKEEELYNILTKTEKKVLEIIIKLFNNTNEGDIRVNQLTLEYNISTSVFRTLFYKIKEYNIASIDSRGVKGTHIIFNNINVLKSIIDKNSN